MFKTITNAQKRPEGKLSTEQSLKANSTQYSLGDKNWQAPLQSNTHACFQGGQPDRAPIRITKGNLNLGDQSAPFVTQTKSTFLGQTQERARPLRDKHELNATNFTIGQDRVEYKTATHDQFRKAKDQPQKVQPVFKNYNQHVDIITGQIKDKNQKSSGYEGFTETKQDRKSANTMNLPQDRYVTDVITGRQIVKRF